MLDMDEMNKLDEQIKYELQDEAEIIEKSLFEGVDDTSDICSTKNLTMNTNVSHIQTVQLGGGDSDYTPF